MLISGSISLFLGTVSLFNVARGAAVAHIVARDGPSPSLTYDPNTTSHCTWWIDLSASTDCSTILSDNSITLETFRRWNPSIPANCGTLQAGRSYCVEAMFEPAPTTTATKTTAQTTTTAAPPTPTKPSNGITTPAPIQPDMVDNCDAFYFVKSGDSCDAIARANGITFAQVLAWNPSVGSGCSGLWANAYICVSIIGVDVPTPTTRPGNGVTTPVPTQVGMVTNCNKFHFVQNGQTCATIAALYSISTSQFTQWNPAAKSDCSGLWASTYACVGLIGSTPPPTTTRPGTGVTTPTPTQPGMVSNCKKFTYVNPGDSCDRLASSNGISIEDFVRWNTGVGGRECRGMWANVYACIGV